MRYLTIEEVLSLHAMVIQQSGGMAGVRDQNALDSAVAQPMMTFGGQDLYPTIADKASALAFSLVMTIHSWMATSAWDMRQWKRSWF